MRVFLAAALSLAATSAAAGEEFMKEFDLNGLTLSGAEYWPYVGETQINYPDDVLWGFYPKEGVPPPGDDEPNVGTATPAAVACAEQAYRKLEAFFAAEQPVLKRIIELGAERGITHKFYLWTNDYSLASDPYPHGMRANRLWYWLRNPPVAGRTPGYWKWESTLTQDGRCLIPEDQQIEQYLRTKLAELEGR